MDGEVVTRPADNSILNGIARAVVLDAIAAKGLRLTERPFTAAEAKAAREAFVTAASQIVQPVIRIDGKPVGDGRPGPLATALRREFHRHAEFT
jgi:D-alanine transaminase